MSSDTNMQVDSPETEIDEGLYSRQLYVLGKDAMKKMGQSNVLIIGLKGLGIEIAKNVALAGVKSITLYDSAPVELTDLSTQFFLTESDIGKPRAEASQAKLAELNQYVPVSVISGELTESVIGNYQVVVAVDTPLETLVNINNFTHKHDIRFIAADIRGLFGRVFVDFGDKFTVVDDTGEEPITGIVSGINEEGLVTVSDETRHGLHDGAYVKFSEVEGLDINDGTPYKVTVTGPYTFSIDISGVSGSYIKGGLFTEVKMPVEVHFDPLEKQLTAPEYLISDFAKFDRPAQLHLGFQALQQFQTKYGNFPAPFDEENANEVVKLTKNLAEQNPSILGEGVEVDEKLIRELSYQARGDIPGMVALYGGLTAQEVLKACTGKFVPIKQWMYFDSLESLPVKFPRSKELCAPIGSRYDNQIAVFGREMHEAVRNLKVFLVGAGAIGCEMLKNWAMMGLGSGPNGKIVVTDMDSIEKSNLNRQFLFRPKDVGKQKAECAAAAVSAMNPDLQGKLDIRLEKVGPETEGLFNDDFWQQLDMVVNALDNVEARRYVDRRCVFYQLPLLESGTLGTKGNTQVVLPFATESYSSSQDPPEKSVPMCTLRSFPNKIDHTIGWAKSLFQGYFTDNVESVNLYLSQPDFVESTLKRTADPKGILESIKSYLVDQRPLTFEECVAWARLEFEKNFNWNIKQLLFNFPKDAVTSTGQPFWSGPKRAPDPLEFDINNPDHFEFIVAAANLRAYNYGLKGRRDRAFFEEVLSTVKIPEFTPKSGVKIQVTDNEANNEENSDLDSDSLGELASSLPPPATLAGFRLNPVEFEKDDDTNFHIDFITAASNCRALNYNIETADRSKTKFIAGRIIPAIATTTALVTGLVCLELYKVMERKERKLEDFKNGFINLALPFFGFSEPIASPKHKVGDREFDKIWSRFDVYDGANMTLQEFLDKFEKEEKLEISMLSYDTSLLYASFFPPKKSKERKAMKMTELIEQVSKKPLEEGIKSIVLEFCADDENGEDVEDVPYCCLHL